MKVSHFGGAHSGGGKNPCFIFAAEGKFRTKLNQKGQLEWSYQAQLKRYQEFAMQHKIPVFIVIGSDLDYGGYMVNIPLSEVKYPALYESVFANYERDPEKPFF